MRSSGIPVPSPADAVLAGTKHAGLADAGLGALLGGLGGRAGELLPQLAQLPAARPLLYDALLGASVLSVAKALDEKEEERNREGKLFFQPGWAV